MQYTLEDLIGQHFKLKDELEELQNKIKKEENGLKKKLEIIKGYINQQLDTLGLESIKTSKGTAFKSKLNTMKVLDWETALNHIKSNELWHVLNKSLSKNNVREIVEESRVNFPGIELGEIVDVKIRRK